MFDGGVSNHQVSLIFSKYKKSHLHISQYNYYLLLFSSTTKPDRSAAESVAKPATGAGTCLLRHDIIAHIGLLCLAYFACADFSVEILKNFFRMPELKIILKLSK